MSRTLLKSDPEWMKRAFDDLGLHEVEGEEANVRIVEMYAAAGHPEVKKDEVAWCAAAIGAWLDETGYPNTGSLLAASYRNYGRPLDTDKKLPRGAILVFTRTGGNHVCFLLEDNGEWLTVIGGNQSDGVTITKMPRSRLRAARWPTNAPEPAQLGAPSIVKSKSVMAAGAIGTTEAVDAVSQAGDALRTFSDVKDSADQIGITERFFGAIDKHPRLVVAVVIVLVCAGLVYWRHREKQKEADE